MTGSRIHDLPLDDRPREKLESRGASALSDAELIAILLRTGKKGASALDIARALIRQFDGSLTAMRRAGLTEMSGISGVGPTKAVQIMAAFALADRLAREMILRDKIEGPEAVERLLGSEMRALPKECLRVLLLDTKMHLIKIEEVSVGTVNESIAHPREILHAAIAHRASNFILVHNHPSGDPLPSRADRDVTRRVAQAAELMLINFQDHVILGSPGTAKGSAYFSFRENGML